MKMYCEKKSDNEIIITFENEISMEFNQFSKDEDNSWHSSISFLHDDEDPSELSTMMNLIDVLQMMVSLREFDEDIQIEFNGDRGGEFYDLEIPDEVMNRLFKEGA